MAKSPRIRHSKTSAEPVTIDLSADEISRVPPESGKPEDNGAASAARPAKESGQASGETQKRTPPTGGPSTSVPPVRPAMEKAGENAPKGTAGQAGEPATGERPSAGGAAAFGRDAKPAASPPPRPEAPPRRGAGSIIAAGLVGGALVLAGAGAAWYGGLLPAPRPIPATEPSQTQALRTEIETLKGAIADLAGRPPAPADPGTGLADANARIESVSVLVEEMRTQLAQLDERLAATDSGDGGAALDELRQNLAALEGRVAALPAEGAGAGTEALRAEMAGIQESVRSAVDAAAAASQAAISASSRINTLEQSLAELARSVEERADTPGVALAIAASALKSAIDRGTPFTTELDTYAGLAPEAPEIAALRELASSGAPTRATIAAETDAAAIRMIDAGRVIDPDAGFFDRLWASARSLVTVRPIGEVEGGDVPAIVARMEAALDSGDYARAIAEYETLPQDARQAGAAFMDKVRARHEADQLVDRALSAALRA